MELLLGKPPPAPVLNHGALCFHPQPFVLTLPLLESTSSWMTAGMSLLLSVPGKMGAVGEIGTAGTCLST